MLLLYELNSLGEHEVFEKYVKHSSEFVEVPLPKGKDKLYINEDGQILSVKVGQVSFGYDEEGHKTVRLDLWSGHKDYRVSLITLIAFGKLKLQTTYYDLVEPFYIDGNKNNLHPSNVGYRYLQPIECECLPGFYYIPFFNNYVISREGEVRNWKTGRVMKSHVVKDYDPDRNRTGGYVRHTLSSDVGNTTIGLHRLLALTFLPYGDNVDKMTVNHKDGRPTNNDLDNLEWNTYRQNLMHGLSNGLFNRTVTEESVNFKLGYGRNVLSGEEIEFTGFEEASKKTGVSRIAIKDRLFKGSQALCKGGWLFKECPETPWREVTDPWPELKALSSGMGLYSKNVFTGEVREHENIAAAGRDLQFEYDQAIKSQILKGHKRPYCGYLFKMKYDDAPWPEFTQRQLAVFRDNPKDPRCRGVIARDDAGEELFFTNIDKAAEHFRQTLKSKNDVIKAIGRGRIVQGFKLQYYNPLTGKTEGAKTRS